MKGLCFALLLAQQTKEVFHPPLHIQELIKKRILHQLKQEDLDLLIYFDNSQCEVLGSYEYTENFFQIASPSLKQEVHLEYSTLIEGKTLNLESIKELIENKKNLALLSTPSLEKNEVNKTSWLTWIIGGAAMGLGALLIGSPKERSEKIQRSRRF